MKKLSFLTRTSLLLSFFFALDKVLAFGKTLLFNKIVGLEGMGIFGAANNIPDYLSALLSGGALGMAFIPVLTEYLDKQGRRETWDLFSRIINLAFVITGGVSLIIIPLTLPLVRYVIAPGFRPDQQLLTASLMRLDFLAILIFSISGLVMASLNANQHFLLPALAPILYNLGQIFGVLILSPTVGLRLGPIHLPGFRLGVIRVGLWCDTGRAPAFIDPGTGINPLRVSLGTRAGIEKCWRSKGADPSGAACPYHGLHSSVFCRSR